MTEVVQLREDEKTGAVLTELFQPYDIVMQVDCADKRVTFEVLGWFCFPRGSTGKAPGVTLGA